MKRTMVTFYSCAYTFDLYASNSCVMNRKGWNNFLIYFHVFFLYISRFQIGLPMHDVVWKMWYKKVIAHGRKGYDCTMDLCKEMLNYCQFHQVILFGIQIMKVREIFFYYTPSAIDRDSLKPLSVLHSKLRFEWHV